MTDRQGEPNDEGRQRTSETPPPESEGFTAELRRRVVNANVVTTLLSIVLALFAGAVLIAFSDPEVLGALAYFFDYPPDTLAAIATSVGGAYWSLFTGSVVDPGAATLGGFFAPLSGTVLQGTPLIAGGLAFALAFRAGLFNIGVEGQITLGAITGGVIGFAVHLPPVIHLLVAVAGGLAGGAVWAGIVGLLKARTGAHEVITTIMLNYVASFLVAYLLTTQLFQRPGRTDPISPIVDETAQMGPIFPGLSMHWGIAFVLAAGVAFWWLMSRSSLGFRFRAVGANPRAARTAGMRVGATYVHVMLAAGAFAGLAGGSLVLGTNQTLTTGISGGIGFDAITVALLGRARPLGTVLAGLLFGALRAGGIAMQAQTATPIDIVLVVQSLIVLFVAAPPVVRAVFRLRSAGGGVGQAGEVSKGWGA